LIKEFKQPYRKFLSTISVAVLASFLKARGTVTLFPTFQVGIKKKTPDLAVDLAHRLIYIEVATPSFAATNA
jgi:hypothetical protein